MKRLPIGVEDYINAQDSVYVDKTLLIKDIIDYGIVIEIKKYKNNLSANRLDDYAEKALAQIKDNLYYTELLRRNPRKILLYGFVFDDRKFSAKKEIIEHDA